MPDETPRLALPFLLPAQAQKHVTHNEALERLDLLTQLTVEAFDATTPPASPEPGQVWALGAGASGAWAGQDGALAAWVGGDWLFIAPAPGWRAALGDDLRLWTGSAWETPSPGNLDNLTGLGVNTTADAINRLAVSSPATLLNHEGDDHQLKINKATIADTASLLFQTGFSGRAEMGTTGDDDFSVKVSADGSSWHDGLVVDGTSGGVNAPNGLTLDGSPVYARGNILGSVSQSGGVPTGAVIERGTNANGEYVRFADGTQICSHDVTINKAIDIAFHGGFRSAASSSPYPASFVATPLVSVTVVDESAFGALSVGAPDPNGWNWAVTSVSSQSAEDRRVNLFAFGRWY